jgi:hypothetical protein
MGAGAGNGAPGTSEGYDGGLDHSTLVIAGVTTVGLIWGGVCARSRRAIGSRDGGPAHAEARTNE